jgi:hypothetical protein
MRIKATLATVIATSGSPAVCDDLRPYTVTVMEQTRHEIVVGAFDEYAARSDALLEARRTSGSGKPWWGPSPANVSVHARQAAGFAVIDINRVPTTPGPYPDQTRLDMVASP